jgi:hypothetical protein
MTIKLRSQPAIESLLSRDLLNSADSIERIYDWINKYFFMEFGLESDFSVPSITLDKSRLNSSFDIIKNNPVRTIGIDFPVLLSKWENRPVMMVCAMDPLRNDTVDKKDSNEIGYWVPFSIINNPARQTKHSEKENLAFFHTLLDTYDLYVTDIFKLFYRKENRISNTISEFISLPVHRTILDAEMQIIKPSVILTLGNNARDAMCELLSLPRPNWTDEIYKTKDQNGIEVVMVPHISGAANGSKAPILKNTAYADVSGKNNVKYAQIIVKTLNN